MSYSYTKQKNLNLKTFARWFDKQFDENIEAVRQISKSKYYIESWWEIFNIYKNIEV